MAMDMPWYDHASNYTGHAPQPIPLLYDPQEVIETYVRLASKPEDEVIVRGADKFMSALRSLVSGLVESMLSKEAKTVEQQAAPTENRRTVCMSLRRKVRVFKVEG